MDRRDLAGVVFCGGASRRMGADKAGLPAPGAEDQTLLERAVGVLAPVVSRVFLATGAAERYRELGLECVLDDPPGVGPLAGLAAALRHADGATLCVLACDMPLVGSHHFEALLSRLDDEALDACLLETSAGVEPLCAVYRGEVLASVERALAKGERRMIAFHNDHRVGTLAADEFSGGDRCAENLNTRDDYARVRASLGPKGGEGKTS